MNTHIKTYTRKYWEIQIDDQKAFNEVVDPLCDYTLKRYSFAFKLDASLFTAATHFNDGYRGKNARLVIDQAKAAVKEGDDVLIFISVREIIKE